MISAGVVARTGKSGGAEDYIVRLYDSLQRENVSSILYGEVEGWGASGRPSVPLVLGDKWTRSTFLQGVSQLPRERAEIERAVTRHPADLFHLHFKREQIGFTDVLQKFGPVLWTEHGRFGRGPYSRLIARLYARAARRVDAIACVSEYVASDVRQITGLDSNVFVIPNAIDTRKFRPPTPAERRAARQRLGLSDDELVFAAVGRLEPNKRPMLAVDLALSMGATLLLAGGGSLEGRVRETALTSNQNIRMLGQIPDARDVYWASDMHLFLSSGAGEGFPTVLVEAAASGLPTLGIDGSGFEAEIRSGGTVAKDGELASLRQVVPGVLAERKAYALSGREWSMAFDVLPWAKNHLDLMNEIRTDWMEKND
ncbi:glycosyltransferase family 4 protein [Arthrobacter sp. SAFR-044]|uniref:glycosyltransferase family 4 protein n=1 Tax=Arthrobacter sp. SAFR-044 TaxID=3387278 RepID=UPI003F7BD168